MQQAQVEFSGDFTVLIGNAGSQAAVMVIQPGDAEGGADNSHKGSDQWLFVQSGKGSAVIAGTGYALKAGTLLLIEHGEDHVIRNTGDEPLRTLNFYVPPAYRADGEPLPRGKPE